MTDVWLRHVCSVAFCDLEECLPYAKSSISSVQDATFIGQIQCDFIFYRMGDNLRVSGTVPTASDYTTLFITRSWFLFHFVNLFVSLQNFFLLSSSMDKTVRLWHISRRECLCCFQHIDFVTAIAFHPRVSQVTLEFVSPQNLPVHLLLLLCLVQH